MSVLACPFYGASIHLDQLIRIGADGSNRCALIVGAHSPCFMTAVENRPADWEDCPRNPEFVARCTWPVGDEESVYRRRTDRLQTAAVDLMRLIAVRDAVVAETVTPPG